MIEKMRNTVFKFLIMLFFHFLFAIILFFTTKNYFIHCIDPAFCQFISFFIHISFAVIYFLLMWKPLYSNNYLHLLKRGIIRTVLKNLFLTASAVLFLFFVIYLIKNTFSDVRALNQNLPGIFLQILIDMAVFILVHCLQLVWIIYLSKIGYLQKNVLIAGKPDRRFPLEFLFQGLVQTKIYSGNLYIETGQWHFKDPDNHDQIFADQEIESLLYRLKIGEIIIFICKDFSEEDIYRLAGFCRNNMLEYNLVPDISKLPARGFWNQSFACIPLVDRFVTNRDSLVYISCKRIIDLAIASLFFIFSLPLFLIIAAAIKLESRGPVFHTSKRVGRNGRSINFYKFRSMVTGAEKLKQSLLQYNLRPDGPLFKMKNDPRMTKVGRLIRLLGLDELPQLLNVLKGDLSLVGPRPHLVSEVKAYGSRDFLRLECIPGMACLPQLHDQKKIGFRQWVALDLEYRKNWSPVLDLKIFFRTLGIVLQLLLDHLPSGVKKTTAKNIYLH